MRRCGVPYASYWTSPCRGPGGFLGQYHPKVPWRLKTASTARSGPINNDTPSSNEADKIPKMKNGGTEKTWYTRVRPICHLVTDRRVGHTIQHSITHVQLARIRGQLGMFASCCVIWHTELSTAKNLLASLA